MGCKVRQKFWTLTVLDIWIIKGVGNTVESGNSSFFPLGSSDSEGNFETPEVETPIRSPLKESCDSSLGLAGPGAETQGKETFLFCLFCSKVLEM